MDLEQIFQQDIFETLPAKFAIHSRLARWHSEVEWLRSPPYWSKVFTWDKYIVDMYNDMNAIRVTSLRRSRYSLGEIYRENKILYVIW